METPTGSNSHIPSSIPIEWVDDNEFQAIENALAFAASASKRSRTSPVSAGCSNNKDASADRRLPDWATHGTDDHSGQFIQGSPSNLTKEVADDKSYEDRKSRTTRTNPYSNDLSLVPSSEAQCQRLECEQLVVSSSSETSSLNSSSNGHITRWGFVRRPCRVALKPKLPKMNFTGRIVYSRTQIEVEKATLELLEIMESKKCNMKWPVPLGFDIEWRPSFRRGELPGKAALLQICMDANRCDVIHVIHSGIPPVLQSLLEDVSSVKVGICIAGDVLKVCKDYNVRVQGIEDLSGLANRKLGGPPKNWSLCALAERLTCKEVEKPRNIRMGNWEVNNLSLPQLQYAATDAFASWYLYEVLRSFPDPPANSKEEENP